MLGTLIVGVLKKVVKNNRPNAGKINARIANATKTKEKTWDKM